MSLMIILSLLLNIAVLVPVCAGILINAGWARECYGEWSPARGILVSIYLAILAASVLLLAVPRVEAAASLLFLQIVYKTTTPITVGTIKNPVVVSNLLIAAFHIATLATLWQSLSS